MNYTELMQYTANCNLGISIDKDTNLNYKYSLPNKIFDFMHAGIPVLASDLPEIASIVNQYQTGVIVSSHDPKVIANQINLLKENKLIYEMLRVNCKKASLELNWEKEKLVLDEIYLK